MNIQPLTDVSFHELLDCYNESFSDYILPFKLSEVALEELMLTRRVKLELSVGAFLNDQLIGFILIGVDEKDGKMVSYNAGTGVVPKHRRNKIVSKLYEVLLPILEHHNITYNVLEVIVENTKAFELYKKMGYTISRELHSFRGNITAGLSKNKYEVVLLKQYDWDLIRSFRDWDPSWQHDNSAVVKSGRNMITIGVFDQQRLAGYLIYNSATKRVFQFGVKKDYRRKGIATALFQYIAKQYSDDIGVINVDAGAVTFSFMKTLGITCFVKQYEMKLDLVK